MSSSQTSNALQVAPGTFPRFSDLPPELQLIVWEIAAAPPRGIYICTLSAGLFPGVPGVAEACKVSREVYLSQQSSTIGLARKQDRHLDPYPGRHGLPHSWCRFDPERDVRTYAPEFAFVPCPALPCPALGGATYILTCSSRPCEFDFMICLFIFLRERTTLSNITLFFLQCCGTAS